MSALLKDIFRLYVRRPETVDSVFEAERYSDRVVWKHLAGLFRIQVTIKKRISDERRLVVEICCLKAREDTNLVTRSLE